MRIWLILEQSSLEEISKDHLVQRASGLKPIIPPNSPFWYIKYKCWAKRSRCSPLLWWLPEHSLILRTGADVYWRCRVKWIQCCLPSAGVSRDFSQWGQGWAGPEGKSSPSRDVGVAVVQGGITSRKPGQELRRDGLFPGEHQAQQHNPTALVGRDWKLSLNWCIENQGFFPFSFYWIELYV